MPHILVITRNPDTMREASKIAKELVQQAVRGEIAMFTDAAQQKPKRRKSK